MQQNPTNRTMNNTGGGAGNGGGEDGRGEGGGGSPLDLNNLPEDCTRDGEHPSDQDPSTSVTSGPQIRNPRTTKNSSKNQIRVGEEQEEDDHHHQREEEAEEEGEMNGKVYECRFCSLKFCKSQALGGHMNRHRQERETESLNKARQLVFGIDSHHHHHRQSPYGNLISPSLHFPSHNLATAGGSSYHHHNQPPPPPAIYPSNPRIYSSIVGGSSPLHVSHPQQPLQLYTSSIPHYPPPTQGPQQPPPQDYFLGHPNYNYNSNLTHCATSGTNYTCVGAPVVSAATGDRANSLMNNSQGNARAGGGGSSRAVLREETGSLLSNWGMLNTTNNNIARSGSSSYQNLGPPSVDHFHDAF